MPKGLMVHTTGSSGAGVGKVHKLLDDGSAVFGSGSAEAGVDNRSIVFFDNNAVSGSVIVYGQMSASVNISASQYYGDGSKLENVAASSIKADDIAQGDAAVTLSTSTGAINITPAAGSAIVLDGTINVDAGVVTGATSITSTAFVGTLSTAAQTNVTSLGTLTALTVDNIAVDGTTIGHTGDTDLITLGAQSVTIAADSALTYKGTAVTATGAELNYLDITTLGTSEASKALTADASGDITVAGAAANVVWDKSEDALEFADNASAEFGTGLDMKLYHDGTNSYITNAVGALKIATETSGIAVTIGHSTSEVTVADNLTVTGDLAATLTTAAQTNITSLGTLTALTVDNIAVDGTTIGHTGDTDLLTLGAQSLTIAADAALTYKGTAVTATGAELNYLDITTLGTSEASKALTADASGDVTIAGAAANVVWDKSADALEFADNASAEFGTGLDMKLYHDGTNSYITNAVGALKIATETSGIAVTIGHGTSEVTIADNLTVSGDLTVTGKTVTDTVEVISTSNGVLFEGSDDAHEGILKAVDPTADRTYELMNVSGYIPMFEAASTTAISATPAEVNLLDGGTSAGTTAVAGSDGIVTNDGGTMRQTTVDTFDTYFAGTTKTLTNKTLTSPTINGGAFTGAITHAGAEIYNAGLSVKNGATSAGFIEFFEDSDNGTNKATLIGPASTADVTLTLPSATDTLVGKATTDTLTNKTIDADNNTLSNLEVDNFKAATIVLEGEGISSNDNDTTIPTSAAVKDYVDNNAAGISPANDTSDVENFMVFANTATGATQTPKTNANLTFNAAQNHLMLSGTLYALTGAFGKISGSINENMEISSDQDMVFVIDANNSGTQNYTFKNTETSIAEMSDDGSLQLSGGLSASLGVSGSELWLASTLVTSTAAELNIVDGGTSATATTLADADRVVVNDNGTMVQVAMTDFETYFESALDTLSNVTTVGALNAGSITSGFGTIDNGTSNITTGGQLSIDVDSGATINSSGGGIGAAGSITLGAGADAGLYVKSDDLYIENKTSDKDIIFRGNDGGTFTTIATVDASEGTFKVETAGKFDYAGTLVTATGAELNLMDGGSSIGTTAVSDGHGIVMNHGGTMAQTTVQTLAAYLDDEITAMPNLVTTAATTVGALNAGSITSGFGAIDNGASNITTTGLISGGSLDIDDVLINGTTIGHTDDTDLLTLADGVLTVAGEVSMTTLDIGGTNVSATAAELNYLDITTLGTSEASKALTADASGDITIAGAAANVVWDKSADALEFADNASAEFGTGLDMKLYHDGTNSYITNAVGALKVATETSGIAVTIGHSTSEVTIGDNLTVTGDLTVQGDTVTVNTSNLLVEDPLIVLNKANSSANGNGGIAIEMGGSSADMVFGRVANDTWGVGTKDTSGGTATDVSDMTLTTFRASKLEIDGASDYIDVDTDLKLVAAADIVLDPAGSDVKVDGNLLPNTSDVGSLGSATNEWADLFLADGATLQFGSDQDVLFTHDATNQLLTLSAAQADYGLKLMTVAGNTAAGQAFLNKVVTGTTSGNAHVSSATFNGTMFYLTTVHGGAASEGDADFSAWATFNQANKFYYVENGKVFPSAFLSE